MLCTAADGNLSIVELENNLLFDGGKCRFDETASLVLNSTLLLRITRR